MVARHDLKKRHHGRRKLGSRKRKRRWLEHHNKRVRPIRSRRRTKKQLLRQRKNYRRYK